MLHLLADENFNGYIVRGLLRRRPDLELVRVQDVGLGEANDERSSYFGMGCCSQLHFVDA